MSNAAAANKHYHPVPLWGLFLALVALTAGEVVLYEVWRHALQDVIAKPVVVLLILLLTLPKAAIVLIYFMHVKFEKQLIVLLAVAPLFMTLLAVLPALTDGLVLNRYVREDYRPRQITGLLPEFRRLHGEGHGGHGDAPHAEPAKPAAPASTDPYGY